MIRGQEEAAGGEAARHSAVARSAFSEHQWRTLTDFAYYAALAETVEAVMAALLTAIADNAEVAWALLYELQPSQAVLRQIVRGGEVDPALRPTSIDLRQDATPWRLSLVAQTKQVEVIPDFNAASENAAIVLPLGPAGQRRLALLVLAVTAANDADIERCRQFAIQLTERVNAIWTVVQNRAAKQHRLQHEAQEVYTSLETILASMSDVFVMLDRDWRYTYVNEKAMASSGFSRTYLLGRSLWEVFPDLVETAFAEQLQRAMNEQQGLSFEYYYATWDRWFENRVYPSARGISLFSTDITDRKRTEAALRESEERFRQMAETIPSVFWLFDPQARELLYVSPAYKTLWGRDPRMLFIDFEQWLDTIHPDDRVQMRTAPDQCMTQGQHDVEYRVMHPDGSLRWIRDRGFLIRDAQGQPYRLAGIAEDITERKHSEEALRSSQERLALASQAATIGTFEWNLETNEVIWSAEEEALYGLPPGGFEGRYDNWKQAVHPEDRYQTEQELLQAIHHGSDFVSEFRIIKPDGSIRWIAARGRVFCDRNGKPERMIGVNEDITERKQAESSQRLLAEASAVLMTSLDYQITLRNIARLVVPTLADYCYFDVVGADGQTQRVAWQHCNPERRAWFDRIQQFVPPAAFQAHPAAAALSSGQAQLVAVTTDAWMNSIAISPEHLQFMYDVELCSLMTVPLIARDRRLGVLTCCFTHESNRHYGAPELALAEELAHRAALALDNANLYRQAQDANRIKDEFLAVLSHELRSPLNPILGWTRLLQTRQFDAPTTTRALQTIERNAKLQTQLIEDLLDVSRILRGKMSLTMGPVDLRNVIEAAVDTVQLAADAKSIIIHQQLSPLGQVAGDAARLQQVVWNLLSNAVKFTPDGGRVEVRLEEVGSGEGEVGEVGEVGVTSPALPRSPAPLPSFAQVTVSDTGKGISPDFLPHVFEYFRQEDGKTTRQFGGLGLGLAIVRYLIELHGGTVWVESAGEGQGATFGFRLPLLLGTAPTPITASEASSDAEAAVAQLRGVRILVVDDEADMRELMTVVLQQQGATVQTVASAAEALVTLEGFQPDLLISDIGMPVTDGYMLIQQIRRRPAAQQRQIPAIALTAYAAETDQQQAHRAGFQEHIAKPVDPRDLVAAILRLLQSTCPDE